jgi:hypothetical protein
MFVVSELLLQCCVVLCSSATAGVVPWYQQRPSYASQTLHMQVLQLQYEQHWQQQLQLGCDQSMWAVRSLPGAGSSLAGCCSEMQT